jgi:hypothetical protein
MISILTPTECDPYIWVMAKTTLEISDLLLRDAKNLAAREGTTLRALVERGLRTVVTDKKRRDQPFRLRTATFGGQGLNPDVAEAGWDRIRDLSYEGRGG